MDIKYQYATDILEDIWLNINWEDMSQQRRIKIWKEFESKIKALSKCYSKLGDFLTKLCQCFDSKLSNNKTMLILEQNNDEIYLNIYRTETQLPILLLKLRRDDKKCI